MSCKHIKISSRAFVKIQLHAAKYPHRGVNGLLLACQDTFVQQKILFVVDVVPLFHQCVELTPMLEVALINVDAHCKEQHLHIAGYYEAPEHLHTDVQPSPFSICAADKVNGNFRDARLVVVDNTKVPGEEALRFFDKGADGRWKASKCEIEFEDDSLDVTEHMLERNVERELVDFDNHLDDISQHWLNQTINQLIVMK